MPQLDFFKGADQLFALIEFPCPDPNLELHPQHFISSLREKNKWAAPFAILLCQSKIKKPKPKCLLLHIHVLETSHFLP